MQTVADEMGIILHSQLHMEFTRTLLLRQAERVQGAFALRRFRFLGMTIYLVDCGWPGSN